MHVNLLAGHMWPGFAFGTNIGTVLAVHGG
jgi:hypothetical protein